MPIATVDPTTGETLRTFPPHDEAAVDAALARAADAAREWRRTPVAERAALVGRIGVLLDERRERYARLMTMEMGKPLQAARDEAAKCATACRYYAEHAARFLDGETLVHDDGGVGRVRYDPLGVVLAVMPWNFPFWQVVRFMAPALAAGNVGVLKHASNVPQCALALAEVVRDAGGRRGLFETLLIPSDRVEAVIADPRVAAVTLTGSEGAGSHVGAAAGRHLKKSVLELGGSDPFVVMPSADLDIAARTAVTARTINNGQSCIAAKRFVVHTDVYEPFLDRFVAGMRALRLGNPMDEGVQVGPLATGSIRDDVHDQVRRTVVAGARLLCGGQPFDGPGFFYPPTVLADVPLDAPAATEEVFGPVAAVLRVPNVDEAIRVANASPYGLGAAAWTTDAAEKQRFEAELDAGSVFLNGMVASDPRLPFGGVKRSGYGRELSAIGMREFVNVKTVREARGTSSTTATTE
ncbi:Aldehyde Dehydrogenase [Gemmatirosa kalamazoonensis]|uniref:Aldehyde Dehydrogenase n=1 Tax=Gemmatirosa kalamazoonensis TaxID=861299 RepID=W0RI39_9BACT|nr:NAD-dependent succinate-semialdehyde dehydrogenase [Gemmatirosa kalamazoonensis]AHG90446.1 Aldehyde Dehydrogenase [Gemmatirosa kalamazoonensis]